MIFDSTIQIMRIRINVVADVVYRSRSAPVGC
jgi:hypothetical protein